MTGAGTQTNPYIVETAEDLYAISSYGSSTKYFKLGNDIDFNETEYAKNFSPIALKAKCLDGDGHTIRGIYKNTPGSAISLFEDSYSSSYSPIEIKNLTIEAELIGSNVTFFRYTYTAGTVYTFNNCCFIFNCSEGAANENALLNSPLLTPKFNYCTLILNGDLVSSHKLMQSGSMTGCQVRSSIVLRASDPTITDNALWYGVTAADTGFFGKIELRNGSDAEGSVLWAYNGSHGNCYQAIEYVNLEESLWNSNISTVCFYDTDKVGSAEVKNTLSDEQDALIFGLTTAQCTDAEYLKSIGYVCEGED